MVVIAIDFGYSVIRVAVFTEGNAEEVAKVTVLENDSRDRSTPNVIAFDGNTRLVGVDAITHAALSPESAVFGIKRIIGRCYEDEGLQNHLKRCCFRCRKNGEQLQLEFDASPGICEARSPDELLAFLFSKIKKNAEQELLAITGVKQTANEAVISVPSYFTHSQRESVLIAAEVNDLKVKRLLNDSTAAAVNYVWDILEGENKRLLIMDFGASSLEVSLIDVKGYQINVVSTVGTTSLGGVDFDNRIMDMCIEKFKTEQQIDISNFPRLIHKLRIACEKAKISLQSKSDVRVKIDHGDDELSTTITRDEFEHRCEDLFEHVPQFVERVFEDTQFTSNDVTDIILVGGSSRLKKVSDLLTENSLKPNKRLNAQEAVVTGAAIYSAKYMNIIDKTIRSMQIKDITPLWYGFLICEMENSLKSDSVVSDGYLNGKRAVGVLVDRNETLPVYERHFSFSRTALKNKKFLVHVVNGDKAKFYNYASDLKYEITHSKSMWLSNLTFRITFSLNENGICNFTLKNFYSASEELNVPTQKHCAYITPQDALWVKRDLKDYNSKLVLEEQRLECKNELENKLNQLKQDVRNEELGESHLGNILKRIEMISNWRDCNSQASLEQIEEKKNELEIVRYDIEKIKQNMESERQQKLEKLKSCITKLSTDLENSKFIINEGYVTSIGSELTQISNWTKEHNHARIDHISIKLSAVTKLETRLNTHINKELAMRKQKKNDLLIYLDILKENPPFSKYTMLEKWRICHSELLSKIDKVKSEIDGDLKKTEQLMEIKSSFESFVSDNLALLEKEEQIRIERRQEAFDTLNHFEQLLNGPQRAHLTRNCEQNIRKIIEESQMWLKCNELAATTHFTNLTSHLRQEYSRICGIVEKEKERIGKRNELSNEAIKLLNILAANNSKLRSDQIETLICSLRSILSWCENHQLATHEELDEKLSDIKYINIQLGEILKSCEEELSSENEIGEENVFVGIDFGTTYCSAAVFKNGECKIIKLEDDHHRMPSYVAFKDEDIVVGSEAQVDSFENVGNTIYNIKKLLGKYKSDDRLDFELEDLCYKVSLQSHDVKDKLQIEVLRKNQKRKYNALQITALLLIKIKHEAENYLGQEITSVNISVPSIFCGAQRQAIIDAGLISGFEKVSIVNDTLAVTTKYLYEKLGEISSKCSPSTGHRKKVLVLSMGACFTSVSVVEIQGNSIEVLIHKGLNFGGDAFDKALIDFILKKFSKKKDLKKGDKRYLLSKCEAMKISLSNVGEGSLTIETTNEETIEVSYSQFEKSCSSVFDAIYNKVRKTLNDATLEKSSITDVFLVGGSTKLKSIQEFFKNHYINAEVSIFNEEAIAVGSAIHSAIKNNQSDAKLFAFIRFTDVSSYTYNFEYKNRVSARLLIGSKLPASAEIIIKADHDYHHFYRCSVFEVKDDEKVNVCNSVIQTTQRSKKNENSFKVYVTVDENGIFSVSWSETLKDDDRKLLCLKYEISETDIKSMTKEIESMKGEIFRKIFESNAKQDLDGLISKYYPLFGDIKGFVQDFESEEAKRLLESGLSLIQRNDCTVAMCNEHKKKIEAFLSRILK